MCGFFRASLKLSLLSIALFGAVLHAHASDTRGGPTTPRPWREDPPILLPKLETEYDCLRQCDRDFSQKRDECRDKYCPDASTLKELCSTLEGPEMFECFKKLELVEAECMAREPDMCECVNSALGAFRECYENCHTKFKPRPIAPPPIPEF